MADGARSEVGLRAQSKIQNLKSKIVGQLAMTASHTNHATRGARSSSSWTGLLLALPLVLFLAAVVAWPVAHLAARVFSTQDALRAVLAAGRYRTSLVNSLALSAV